MWEPKEDYGISEDQTTHTHYIWLSLIDLWTAILKEKLP